MLPQLKRILYATDLGENTRSVFRYAISLAQCYGAQISMLHTLEPLGTTGAALLEAYLPRETAEKLHQNALEEVREKMQQRLAAFCLEELNMSWEESHLIADIAVLDGHSAQTIVNYSRQINADLIVMGTHSYSVVTEFLIGSTARKVTQLSTIPVLIVPLPEKTPL
ncbi:universal stress protein [Thioflexithrix psekupsensis]|uniref:Universal stress protein UspA n=1 Tax=Thioflexithrix psekupsensis TaxID=1570016 RepID=A0A251X713_9GAMM|nr:universal stress protein [Thioflexithrix psekupsensis]OUD12882.1 universal stress protein UspA [Thioflexithrix psekupsensis]